MKKNIVLLLFVCFLSACSPIIPLNQENVSKVKTIYVQPEINVNGEMIYEGREGKLTKHVGLISLFVLGSTMTNKTNNMKEFVDKNKIDIRKIVYQQWIKQLNQTKFIQNKSADAIMTIEIKYYGIKARSPFTDEMGAVMKINAKLTWHDQVIWEDSDDLIESDKVNPGYTEQEILEDPQKLVEMWDKISEKIIKRMLARMVKN